MTTARRSPPADGIAWRLGPAVALEVIGSVATVGSAIVLVEACRAVLAGDTPRAGDLVLAAVVTVVIGLLVQLAGRVLSRIAAVRGQEAMSVAVRHRIRTSFDARTLRRTWMSQPKDLGRDIESSGVTVGRALPELVSAVLVAILSVGYVFWADWRMALITLSPIIGGFLTFGVVAARFEKNMRTDYDAAIDELDAAGPRVGLEQRIQPPDDPAVIAGTVQRSAAVLADTTDRFAAFFKARIGTLLAGRALAEIAFAPLTILVFVLVGGSVMVRSGRLAPADLLPFLIIGVGLALPLLAITYLLEESAEGLAGRRRLASFTRDDTPAGADPGRAGPDLPAKGVVALVEDSPAAVDDLLDRIIGGAAPRDVAAVGAEPPVVIGTVAGYITADTPDALPGDAVRAARQVGVHDLVTSLPRGYESVVGVDVFLSPAEGRLLALARAVHAPRARVLLDERAFTDHRDTLAAAVAALGERTCVVTVAERSSR